MDSSPVSDQIGMFVTLQCSIALPNGISNTQLSDTSYYIEWIYNGAIVDMSNTPISTDTVVSQYIVNTLSQSTVGNYICEVSIIYTGDQSQYVNNSNDVSETVILQTTS